MNVSAPGDTARLYHRLTAYEPKREWDRPVEDPRGLKAGSATTVLAGRERSGHSNTKG